MSTSDTSYDLLREYVQKTYTSFQRQIDTAEQIREYDLQEEARRKENIALEARRQKRESRLDKLAMRKAAKKISRPTGVKTNEASLPNTENAQVAETGGLGGSVSNPPTHPREISEPEGVVENAETQETTSASAENTENMENTENLPAENQETAMPENPKNPENPDKPDKSDKPNKPAKSEKKLSFNEIRVIRLQQRQADAKKELEKLKVSRRI